jgi:hypothetical protein
MLAYAVRAAPAPHVRRAYPNAPASDIVSCPVISAGSGHRTFTPARTLFAMAQGTLLDKKVINP